MKRPEPKLPPSLEFDKRGPFAASRGFGPGSITKALKAGFYVMAELYDAPGKQWAVDGARWRDGALEVHGLNGFRVATRVWTLKTTKGLKL